MKHVGMLGAIERYEESLRDEIAYWKDEAEHWRKQHNDQLTSAIRHGDAMFGLVLRGAMDGAFRPRATDSDPS